MNRILDDESERELATTKISIKAYPYFGLALVSFYSLLVLFSLSLVCEIKGSLISSLLSKD